MLPFFVYKNKFLKNVNKFGGFRKLSYICGVKEEPFPNRYLFKYLYIRYKIYCILFAYVSRNDYLCTIIIKEILYEE